ncbi:unnamed protein product [Parnassius apollo]|uniref:(apollo) hypothetical protein n=1 Tax=Parnassius apollo TaxID=110799 RepID=A0A8S3YCR5_PARAO|nr:unnamed protein product [Parnassius apollo]
METAKLITLVRERCFLYDVKNNDYKNRAKVAEAWLEIAREMGTENGKKWSNKWKSLRDNYKKFKKSTETASGSAYKKYKNWPWAEQLRFLDDTVTLKETHSNINSENNNSTSLVSNSDNQTRPEKPMLQDDNSPQGLVEFSSHEMDELLDNAQHVMSNEARQVQSVFELWQLNLGKIMNQPLI